MARSYTRQDIYQPHGGSAHLQASAPHLPGLPAINNIKSEFSRNLLQSAIDAGLSLTQALAKGYAEAREAKADQLALRHARDFELYKADYMEKNQGANALSAATQWAEHYGESAERLLAESGIGQNERAYQKLAEKLKINALVALKDGQRYQEQQSAVWKKSHWQSELEESLKAVASNAADDDLANLLRQRLSRAWENFNPGLDSRQIKSELADKFLQARFETLLNSGNLEAAQALLKQSAGIEDSGKDVNQSAGIEENGAVVNRNRGEDVNRNRGGKENIGANYQQSAGIEDSGEASNRPDNRHSASSDNNEIASNRPDDLGAARNRLCGRNAGYVANYFNNPGNVRQGAGNFAIYATFGDGVAAIIDRFQRYHHAPERGWHARTIREIFTIYAPPDENNTNAYVKTISRLTGIDADAPLNFQDKETMAKLAAATIQAENSVKYSTEKLMPYVEQYFQQGKPRPIGSFPDKMKKKDQLLASGELDQFLGLGRGKAEHAPRLNHQQSRMWRDLQNAYAKRDAEEKAARARSLYEQLNEVDDIDSFISEQPMEIQSKLRAEGERIKQRRKNEYQDSVNGSLDDLIRNGLQGNWTDSQILDMGNEFIEKLPGEMRKKSRETLKDSLKNYRDNQKSKRLAQLDDLIKANPNLDSESLYQVAKKQFADDAEMQDLIYDHFRGGAEKENARNKDALAEAFVKIDNGELRSPQARAAYAYDQKLTYNQRQEMLNYQGRRALVSFSSMKNAFLQIAPDIFDKREMSLDDFNAALQFLEPGKKSYSDYDLRMAAAKVVAHDDSGFWLFKDDQSAMDYQREHGSLDGFKMRVNNQTKERMRPGMEALELDADNIQEVQRIMPVLLEHQSNGKFKYNLPLTEDEKNQIKSALAKAGLPNDDQAIQYYAKQNIIRKFAGQEPF